MTSGETIGMGPDDQPGTNSGPTGGSPLPGALRPPEPPQQDSGPSAMLIGGTIAIIVAVAVLGFVLLSSGGDSDDEPLATADPTAEPEQETPEEENGDVGEEPEPTAEAEADPTPAEEEPEEQPEEETGPPTTDRLAQSVVHIQLRLNGQPVCTGSGTILEADGTILTNSHVIDQTEGCPHDSIAVGITDVPELPANFLFEADLLVQDRALDLAVIRIARTIDGSDFTPDFPTLAIGDSDTVGLGEAIRVIGYPAVGGETITFTEGTVSGFVSLPGVGDRSWLKTDATISGGNSGGLAANEEGEIVGVPTIAGTGNGRITDCRVVEDTNGDGAIDNNDSCIPIGGFINGIRPINLALPLLEQARTASPIDQGPPPGTEPVEPEPLPSASSPVWATGVQDGFPVNDLVKVRRTEQFLCLTWQYQNVAPGAPVEVVWQVDGETIPEQGFVGNNQGAAEGGFFACYQNDAGIGGGLFEMAWFVDGDPVFSHSIYVGGGRDELTIDFINDTETDICVVQFAPTDALTFGLNRLSDVVPPGQTLGIPLVTGSYKVRVIDCDGALRFEDAAGTRLEADNTLTVV